MGNDSGAIGEKGNGEPIPVLHFSARMHDEGAPRAQMATEKIELTILSPFPFTHFPLVFCVAS